MLLDGGADRKKRTFLKNLKIKLQIFSQEDTVFLMNCILATKYYGGIKKVRSTSQPLDRPAPYQPFWLEHGGVPT